MYMRRQYLRAVGLGVIVLILAGTGRGSESEQTAEDGLRSTMRAIFQALTTALPLSLNAEQFQDEANRPAIHQALQALADNAARLSNHAQDVPARFDFLRQSLNSNAQEALDLFEQGHSEESRFLIHQLTDNCFLCHSRVPSSRPFPLGKHLLDHVPMSQLSPHERVRLAVAARQFDTALTTCEALFRSDDISATEIDLMAFFEDYMRIAIRVNNDFARVIKTLEDFRQRSDVPRYLDQQLMGWIDSLKTLQDGLGQGDELLRGRELIQQGQHRNRFLADRQGLVYFIVASSLLHRYVNTGTESKPKLAEAYYYLGVAESYVPRTSWISETEFLLETAIRLAPTSPYGKKAFAFLEEYLIVGYSGSSGLHLPSDVKRRLDDLRQITQGS